MKVLITGFAPFGGDAVNPTEEAVKALSAPEGVTLCKVILPVTWQDAFPTLLREVERFSPDAVLMTGLAGGSERLRIERVGINLCGALRDADGKFPAGETPSECPVCPDGENAYFSTFDHQKLLSALKNGGFSACASYSAGTYLCNYVLYSMLRYAKIKEIPLRAGFLHVPYASEMKKEAPSLPLSRITEALAIAVSNL